MEILEALVKRDWMLKEPGVGWREEYDTAERTGLERIRVRSAAHAAVW